ncbi:MAG TPA: cytochrome c, partial [Vicinamibacterales bacterium]|nr:cytochrome c [Vicinamibacterales bacterium]
MRRIAASLAIVSFGVVGAVARTAQQPASGTGKDVDGRAVFERDCDHCHNGSEPRAPSPGALRGRAPQAILDALTSGSMRYQGLTLSGAERRAVAEFLAGRTLRGSVAGATIDRCATPAPLGDPNRGPSWNGWSPTIENTHFQSAGQAGLTAEQVPKLRLKWAFGFPDTTSAWAQPTI